MTKTIAPNTELQVSCSKHYDEDVLDKTWFKCDVCNMKFPSLLNVTKHSHLCKVAGCNVASVDVNDVHDANELMKHIVSHAGVSRTNQSTAWCEGRIENSFSVASNAMVDAKKEIANDDRRKMKRKEPLVCNECGKYFKNLSNLRSHEKQHAQSKQVTGLSRCPSKFEKFPRAEKSHSKGVVEHANRRVVQSKSNFVQCNYCNFSSNHSRNLITHIRSHTKKKSHQCNECKKCFIRPSALVIHSRVHTGERPYHCDICDKAYKQINALRLHQRTHTGERPYTCNECGKSFITSDHLKVHYRTHTGERPYTCLKCGMSFKQPNNLNRHMEAHKQVDKLYECENCGFTFRTRYQIEKHMWFHLPDIEKTTYKVSYVHIALGFHQDWKNT